MDENNAPDVQQVVPFFGVTSVERSVAFYTDGLGFVLKNQWAPDGKLRWCWLTLGGSSLMLQEFWTDGSHQGRPDGKLGQGVSLCWICRDAVAIYREVTARGIAASEPQVGNNMWVTHIIDPDGYHLYFESPTDVPEETRLSEVPRLSSD